MYCIACTSSLLGVCCGHFGSPMLHPFTQSVVRRQGGFHCSHTLAFAHWHPRAIGTPWIVSKNLGCVLVGKGPSLSGGSSIITVGQIQTACSNSGQWQWMDICATHNCLWSPSQQRSYQGRHRITTWTLPVRTLPLSMRQCRRHKRTTWTVLQIECWSLRTPPAVEWRHLACSLWRADIPAIKEQSGLTAWPLFCCQKVSAWRWVQQSSTFWPCRTCSPAPQMLAAQLRWRRRERQSSIQPSLLLTYSSLSQ